MLKPYQSGCNQLSCTLYMRKRGRKFRELTQLFSVVKTVLILKLGAYFRTLNA